MSIEILTGSRLEAWLDEIEAQQEPSDDTVDAIAGAEPAVNWAALLNQYAYQADTMESVWRLHRLWVTADNIAEGLKVVDQAHIDVLPNLPIDDQHEAQVRMAFWRANAIKDDAAQCLDALKRIEQTLQSTPGYCDNVDVWSSLAERAFIAEAYTLERRCAERIYQLKKNNAERMKYRAWDEASFSAQQSASYGAEGSIEQAQHFSDVAINALSQADSEQDVDVDDWLKVGNLLIGYVPSCYAEICLHIRESADESAHMAVKRELEVKLARFEANAMYKLGDIEAAIAKGLAGHYGLRYDDDDSFGGTLMTWMLEAKQLDAAAHLAFESTYSHRDGAWQSAIKQALQQIENQQHKNAYWPLCLAYACTDPDLQECLDINDEAESEVRYLEYLQLAQQWEPEHPAIKLLNAEMLFSEQNYAAARPLLADILQSPVLQHVANGTLGFKLWVCLIKEYGVRSAFEAHAFTLNCGVWCYTLAVEIDELKDYLDDEAEWPSELADSLEAQYYEQGLASFERFFATGQGYYRDGDIHTYSMLCNNLAINYRYDQERYTDALTLHQQGIASSPFAEHYNGRLTCYKKLEQSAEYVKAAEDLWLFADKHGYSRHEPEYYVWQVTNKLYYELDRPHECAIWLQRLTAWWDELDAEERQEHAEDYWANLPIVIDSISYDNPQDAVDILNVSLPEIVKQNNPVCTRRAADVYEEIDWPKALELYELALSQVDEDNEDHDGEIGIIKTGIKDCQRAIKRTSGKKVWWHIW